jgi:hypothetical protein
MITDHGPWSSNNGDILTKMVYTKMVKDCWLQNVCWANSSPAIGYIGRSIPINKRQGLNHFLLQWLPTLALDFQPAEIY